VTHSIQVLSDIGVWRAREEAADKRLSSSEVFIVHPSTTLGIKPLNKNAWDLSAQIFQPTGKEKRSIEQLIAPKFKVSQQLPLTQFSKRKLRVWF
jgi:hypothetical protein